MQWINSFAKGLMLFVAVTVIGLLGSLYVRGMYLKHILKSSGIEYSQETYVVHKVLEDYYGKSNGDGPTIRKWKRRSKIDLGIPRYFFQKEKYVEDDPVVLGYKGFISEVGLHFCYPNSGPVWPCSPRRPYTGPKTSHHIQLWLQANFSSKRSLKRMLNNKIKGASNPKNRNNFQFVESDLDGFEKYITFFRRDTRQFSTKHSYIKRDSEGNIIKTVSCRDNGMGKFVSCGSGFDIDNRLQVGYTFPGALWPEWRQLDMYIRQLVSGWLVGIEKYNTHLDTKWGLDK